MIGETTTDRLDGIREQQRVMQALERATILLHRQQCHAMCSVIVKAHLRLRSADLVREWTTARYDDDAASAASDRGDPIP
jgi:ferredoxin